MATRRRTRRVHTTATEPARTPPASDFFQCTDSLHDVQGVAADFRERCCYCAAPAVYNYGTYGFCQDCAEAVVEGGGL